MSEKDLTTIDFSGIHARLLECCELIADGMLNKEIAHRMGISEGAAKSYVCRVMEATGLSNRVHIAVAFTHYKYREAA